MAAQQQITELFSMFLKLSKKHKVTPRPFTYGRLGYFQIEKEGEYLGNIDYRQNTYLGENNRSKIVYGEKLFAQISFPDHVNEEEHVTITWPHENSTTNHMHIAVGGRGIKSVQDYKKAVDKAMDLVTV